MKDHRIKAEQIGDLRWPRWIIKNNDGFVFTGKTWSEDLSDALLFAEQSLADNECERLASKQSSRRFQTTIFVDVDAKNPFCIQQIRDYLSRNTRIELGDDDGVHPCDLAEHDFRIAWEQLEELE